MSDITGVVQNIIFRNGQNGYTVLSLYWQSAETTVVGVFPFIEEGETLSFTGEFIEHKGYGRQFKAVSYRAVQPDTPVAIERYLASGQIKGIGLATARLIVHAFGKDTFDVLTYNPQRLAEIPGIGKKRAVMIGESFARANQSRAVMMFLQGLELTPSQCLKVYKAYGDEAINKIRQDPYRLVYDIPGVGFLTADKIAGQSGIAGDNPSRLSAGICYIARDAAMSNGHVYLPREVLAENAARMLNQPDSVIGNALDRLIIDGALVLRDFGGCHAVFLPYYDSCESETAARLAALCAERADKSRQIADDIAGFERRMGITLDPAQVEAIRLCFENGVCVLTGGPGTGKTTIINCLLDIFESENISCALCAPTGRAAKRMSEATGREARTIHRLLEYGSGDEFSQQFARNENEPLECGSVIVDEMSMVDIALMRALLCAMPAGARLVMVGDADQLMSVGAGNVLRDLIDSGVIPVAKLTEIFRQEEGSAIITNAHRINSGRPPVFPGKGGDFFIERKESVDGCAQSVLALVKSRLPDYYGFDPVADIQVLCPMKKGEAGVNRLNERLQSELNPPSPKKAEKRVGSALLREGDKVMQVKNNYTIPWIKGQGGDAEEGMGAYNGDIGVITGINTDSGSVAVLFDDGREAEYDASQADELDLAYALSVHKSQGSEFNAVILPLHSGPPMLMTRNLLYTAVTRAKKLVVIVGRERTVAAMIGNNHISMRYSALSHRLRASFSIM